MIPSTYLFTIDLHGHSTYIGTHAPVHISHYRNGKMLVIAPRHPLVSHAFHDGCNPTSVINVSAGGPYLAVRGKGESVSTPETVNRSTQVVGSL